MAYNFKAIEKKWQRKWEEKKVFEVKEGKGETRRGGAKLGKKYYVLEMYPYPSGTGLHMGHAFNYVIGDILARFKRMHGFNVLHPMGYDSFGLPAENAAIKANVNPRIFTDAAIKNFIKQQKALGLSYAWERMLMSHDENYYKWNQWIFIQLFKKGLVYKKKAPVNYCAKCNTVLANEQVHNGKCWRHTEEEVEIKNLEQWFIKITDYAEELLKEIDGLDWPERIKTMQRNWIGKSEGAEVAFEIEDDHKKISNVIIVHGSNESEKESKKGKPENLRHWKLWLKRNLEENRIKVSNELYPEDWIPDYEKWKKVFEKNKIDENTILVGHSAGTAFILRWLSENKKKIDKLILIAPSVIKSDKYKYLSKLKDFDYDSSLKNYFNKLVIFYSDNDDEDIIKSAKQIHAELDGELINLKGKGHFCFEDMKTEEFPELLNGIISNKKFSVFTTRPDTLFGVTFLAISPQHPSLDDFTSKAEKKNVEKFLKSIKSTKQEDIDKMEKSGVFTGSYAVHPLTRKKIPVWIGNFVVAEYGSGIVMGVPAHDERDFEFARRYGIPAKVVIRPENEKIQGLVMDEAYTGNGKLINSEGFNDLFSEEAKEHITKFLQGKKLGGKKIHYKLRDWLVSRQRYWGTPIPILYDEKGNIIPVDEKDLPIKLPNDVKFGKGNPMKTSKSFMNVKKNGKNYRRETDTMDTFFDSSWYFLKFTDSKNKKKMFDKKNSDYWMPVDFYTGGAEHACMHLIYARFFTKVLRDLGFVGKNLNEPFKRLLNQGMVHGEDGFVMSKSRGNVVDPLSSIEKYGADTLRLFLVSIASPESDFSWNSEGVEGMHKFLNKLFEYFSYVKTGKSNARVESKINKAIMEISKDVENLRHNLAIIKIRGLFEFLHGKEISKKDLETCMKIIAPFAPHVAEEFWEKIGNKNFIAIERWPKFDESKIDKNLEKEEKLSEELISDILNVLKIVKEKGKNPEKLFIYTIPKEKEIYENFLDEISKRTNLKTKIFAVNEKIKHDPENKSGKSKPGKPAIYLE